jgi:GT2 family glycosyltransferase
MDGNISEGIEGGRAGDARVAVVMITLNGGPRVFPALQHLTGLPERPRVVVVDNGSSDCTGEAILRRFPGVTIVDAGTNLGSAGRTLGVQAVDAPYIAFAEDDSWYAPGSLALAADVLDAHPEIGLLQAHVLVGPNERPDPLHADMVGTPVQDAPELPGHPILSFLEGASIVRRTAYLAVGGYDPRLLVGGPEEHLAADLLTAGWKLRYVPEIVAHHHPDHGEPSPFVRRLGLRNTLWFAWRRRPPRAALRWTAHVVGQSGLSPNTVAGLVMALAGLPRVLRHRRPLPPEVERQMAQLDEPKRRSRARNYSGNRTARAA